MGADRVLRADSRARRRLIEAGRATGRTARRFPSQGARTVGPGVLPVGLHLAALLAAVTARAEVEISA